MDKLWAPWRINYISGKRKVKGCIFCLAKKEKSQDQVIFKTRFSIAMLNIYPYNNGHMLISPLRHIRDIAQLQEEEILDLFKSLNKAKNLLQKVLKPQGYNIGFNLTRVAGAGITGHLHLHIVPRWVGDTNFMPVVFGTKIISQSLKQLAKKLKDANR
ncbi:MAG: HIT domain-containing protein [Candidatus Omnitrophica bacterium]|jgi:ATP adenylyltransferase|nr:HIT domain-containing protein [Candidatus Omnitrophota bacterium]